MVGEETSSGLTTWRIEIAVENVEAQEWLKASNVAPIICAERPGIA